MATVLVTGAKGCIGAWTLRALLDAGHDAISLDLLGNLHRLELVLGDDLARVRLVDGDILDADGLKQIVQDNGVTNLVHLAALQIPAARANPTLGAQINVVGTVNVFEAARAAGINHVAYASSIATYNDAMELEPATLYGIWKLANEGAARIYYQDHNISSIAMRPYVVYGLARDTGLTSTPTVAMMAAAAGKNYHIPFGGKMLYHTAKDMGLLFMRSALATDYESAGVFNPPGEFADTAGIVAAINAVAPDVTITYDDVILPFPTAYDTGALAEAIGAVEVDSIQDGVRETIEGFKVALAAGKVELPEAN
jgi:nucleoside-diphosphate-sugar epimerase